MKFDKFYKIVNTDNEVTDYVYLDTSKSIFYAVAGKTGFETAVSFSVKSKISMNYPVVFDDYTVHGYKSSKLVEIVEKDIPATIKRKFTNWKKYQ